MPQQLVYTSSPRGLMAGRSGYCIVACSEGMRDALQLNLEQISYYDHLIGASGGQPVVNAYRLLNIRGSLYHVLSRIADAGLDFTKRTNFIAHHLVFHADELQTLGKSLPFSPAVVFLHWNGWCNRWDGESKWLKNPDWGNLLALAGNVHNPARQWQELTGDAANGLALWDSTSQDYFSTDGLGPQQLLGLLAESLALSAVRPTNEGPWEQTFTTYLQERDDVADFRWRMLQSTTVACERLVGRNVVIKPLATLRPKVIDELAAAFARSGPQPVRITGQPEDQKLRAGQPLILKVVCSGIPPPQKYQWYACPRTGNRQVLNGGNGPELRIDTPPRGASRYVVVISDDNKQSVESRIATVEVELDMARPSSATGPAKTTVLHRKKASVTTDDEALEVRPQKWKDSNSEDEDWESEEAEEEKSPGLNWKWIGIGIFLVVFGAMAIFLIKNILASPKLANGSNNLSSAVTNVTGETNSSVPSTTNPPTPSTNPPPAVAPDSSMPKSAAKLALLVLETNIDLQTIQGIANQIQETLERIKSNSEQKKQVAQQIEAETAKSDKEKKEMLDLQSEQRNLEKQATELNTRRDASQSQADTLSALYNKQKDKIDGTLSDKLRTLFYLSPGQPACLQAAQLDENQPTRADGVGAIELSTSRAILQLTTTTNEAFGITGIEVQKNNLGGPLMILVATNNDFAGSAAAKLLIWPTGVRIPATCDEDGNLSFSDSRFLDPLIEFSGPENYVIEINVGYLAGGGYLFSTNFPMNKTQRYVFAGLKERLVAWSHTLNIVTNIMALDGGQSSSETASNIWDDLGKICQRMTHSRASYDFSSDPKNYSAVREEVLQALDTKDKRDMIGPVLSNENLENLKSFLADQPEVMTFDSAKSKLRNLLPPTKARLNERLRAGITFKDARTTGGKEALANVVFPPSHN